ncbi:hypothetical protein HF325_004760 [Metschnikowia pulcherrima]|uniref:Arf-GAP domain-containing protein n=1 Tax=Metschnikowia pulcherrima TaxID=27326 RepID=A0A8H7L8S9_9ASCO|nr:hypothetical protein HF325_004760 [Metschnikowia pulcherrima]
MFRKSHKQAERQILDVVNSRVNGNRCGECGADYPTWALVNLGILLCGRCASSHRKVLAITGPNGDQISRVKSLTLENWLPDEIEALRRVGNKRALNRWNPKQVPFPHDDDDDGPIQEWLREKYVFGRFRDDRISLDDYGSKLSKYTGESGYNSPDNRSRLSSTINKSKAGPPSYGTGVVRGANGQQYLDPNNPQHQQMLAQQTNPQFLTQQATKQNIMSLYSQPEQYATNVAAPMQPGQAQAQVQPQMLAQTQAQPQLQQQFTQQFAQPQFTGVGYGGGQFYGQVPQQPTQTGQQFGQQQYWR